MPLKLSRLKLVTSLKRLLLNTRDPRLDVRRRLFVTSASLVLKVDYKLPSLKLKNSSKLQMRLVDTTQMVLTIVIEKLCEHLFFVLSA